MELPNCSGSNPADGEEDLVGTRNGSSSRRVPAIVSGGGEEGGAVFISSP